MKLESPIRMSFASPPRRALGMARYVIFAAVVLGLLYYLRLTALSATLGTTQSAIDLSLPGTIPSQKEPTNPLHAQNPASSPGTDSSDHKNEHEFQAPSSIVVTPSVTPSHAQASNTAPPAAHRPAESPGAPPVAPSSSATKEAPVASATSSKSPHPIDTLMERAAKAQEELLKKESHDLKSAAAAYRKRRGRHPPPGFDVWYDFAKEKNAIMVEDFFDQIHHDLAPYWGLPAPVLRKESHAYDMTIKIRNQQATSGSNWFWTDIWLNMTKSIQDMLPDMDLPLNAMDEPRISAPWEEVDKLMKVERASRKMPPPHEVLSEFQTLPLEPENEIPLRHKNFSDTRPYWQAATRGCHPESLARKAQMMMQPFNSTPPISLTHTVGHTYKGYVSNYTASNDFCAQPDLQSLHGMFINPLSVSETKVFAPLFGGSKLPTNNEILLPAPMYWSGEERFSGGGATGGPWSNKTGKAIWRGVATGGRNTKDNWRGFQRHRFVAQTNGSKVSNAEAWTEIPENWAMPTTQYNLAAQQEGRLGEWTSEWADTGFVDLMCDTPESGKLCNYTDPHYKILPGIKLGDQFNRKYLPDIDGNSFSGRYRGFLMSTSVPIKATIFREWHDSRLMPWLHFVPMDNRFLDFWGIMEYFVGYKGKNINVPAHDAEGERIAIAGQEWANKVLRREDMQIYVLRLLLEYARLNDDRRNNMGYVGDLVATQPS